MDWLWFININSKSSGTNSIILNANTTFILMFVCYICMLLVATPYCCSSLFIKISLTIREEEKHECGGIAWLLSGTAGPAFVAVVEHVVKVDQDLQVNAKDKNSSAIHFLESIHTHTQRSTKGIEVSETVFIGVVYSVYFLKYTHIQRSIRFMHS